MANDITGETQRQSSGIQIPRLSASAVVVLVENDGRYLFICERRVKGQPPVWYFPAGSVDAGESLAAAARRETLEETGWSVEPTHLLRIDHGYFNGNSSTHWWRHVIVSALTSEEPVVDPESDIIDVAWFRPDELEHRRLRDNDALQIIRTYQESGPGLSLENGYAFADDGTLPGFFQ